MENLIVVQESLAGFFIRYFQFYVPITPFVKKFSLSVRSNKQIIIVNYFRWRWMGTIKYVSLISKTFYFIFFTLLLLIKRNPIDFLIWIVVEETKLYRKILMLFFCVFSLLSSCLIRYEFDFNQL